MVELLDRSCLKIFQFMIHWHIDFLRLTEQCPRLSIGYVVSDKFVVVFNTCPGAFNEGSFCLYAKLGKSNRKWMPSVDHYQLVCLSFSCLGSPLTMHSQAARTQWLQMPKKAMAEDNKGHHECTAETLKEESDHILYIAGG